MRRTICMLVLFAATAVAPPSTALGIDQVVRPLEPHSPFKPRVTFESSWEWCSLNFESWAIGPYPYSPEEHCSMTVVGHDLRVLHYDAVFNCCIDDIDVTVQMLPGLIRIQEHEIWTQPCYCYCYFPVATGIHGLPAGDYVVEVWCCWMGGEEDLRCSADVHVPG